MSMLKDIYSQQYLDQLEKGGEGSKGGKVIGHTSSGKAIYDKFDHPSHKDFTSQDHKDASKIHHDIAGKQTGSVTNDISSHHWEQGGAHDMLAKKTKPVSRGTNYTPPTPKGEWYQKAQQNDMKKSQDNIIGVQDYINQKQNPYLSKSFAHVPSESEVRANLKDKLVKGTISQELHDKAVEQLDDLMKGHLVTPDGKIHVSKPDQKAGGGEGSRGGHVIGHTKTGKAVYAGKAGNDKSYKDFTEQDHMDAHKFHMDEANRHAVAGDNLTLVDHHDAVGGSHVVESSKKRLAAKQASLSSDEKKIIADQKKKQIDHHEKSHAFHSDIANHIAEKYGKDGKYASSYELHSGEAKKHLGELDRLQS